MVATREALAFDVHGTLVDPIRIGQRLAQWLPDDAPTIARVWRQKQLEYTFRLTAMERYEDFGQVTRKALAYALAGQPGGATHVLSRAQQDALLAQYDDLDCFPDVLPGLERLHSAGHLLAVCSNGTPAMLRALLDATGLRPCFGDVISVDEVRVYKPSPRVYLHLARRLGRPPGEVRLVSSNPFDVIGAEAAGLRAAWIDRAGGVYDTLAPPPDVVVGSLVELADRLAA